GNIRQSIRLEAKTSEDGAEEARALISKDFAELCKRAAAESPRPDLIVWPETSYPGRWQELHPDVQISRVRPSELRRLAKERQDILNQGPQCATNVLLGLNTHVHLANNKTWQYNSGLLIQKNGTIGGRYDKVHLVPFGEFVPFRDTLPFMNAFNAYGYDFSAMPGEKRHRLPLDKYKFGVLICYEDTDPTLSRTYVVDDDEGPPVDFLVNISNDGWFDGTSEHDEHLAICRFRAIESRRPVVRAVNMGISAVIDGNGQVLRPDIVSEHDHVFRWEIKDSLAGEG